MKQFFFILFNTSMTFLCCLQLPLKQLKHNEALQIHNNNLQSWIFLGKSPLEQSDNGNVTIKMSSSKKIKSLRFSVIKGGLNIRKCEAWMIDGSKKTIELRNELTEGEESRVIEISNNPMEIEKISITYDSRNHKAVFTQLELWGKME